MTDDPFPGRDAITADEYRRLVDGDSTMPSERTTTAQDKRKGHRTWQTSETMFRDRVVALAKRSGWMTYFTQRSDRSPAGFPDLVLLRGEAAIVAELKLPGGKLSVAQYRWLEAWKEVTGNVWVFVWTPDDIDEIERMLT